MSLFKKNEQVSQPPKDLKKITMDNRALTRCVWDLLELIATLSDALEDQNQRLLSLENNKSISTTPDMFGEEPEAPPEPRTFKTEGIVDNEWEQPNEG